jgi:hypothetical protein
VYVCARLRGQGDARCSKDAGPGAARPLLPSVPWRPRTLKGPLLLLCCTRYALNTSISPLSICPAVRVCVWVCVWVWSVVGVCGARA